MPKEKRVAVKGFSLMEMTVVLLVLSIISTMGISLFREKDYSRKQEQTKAKLAAITAALENYSNSNQRLPCPADGSLADGSTGYGWEGKYAGSCRDAEALTAGLQNSNFADGETVAGVLPIRTLQLPDDMMLDAWGRRITYVVDRRMTHMQATLKFGVKNCDVGSIRINDASGTARTTRAIYALISHGENGHGAFLSSGQRRNFKSANASEQLNAHYNATAPTAFASTFIMKREEKSATNVFDTFDDIVAYKERWAIANAADVIMSSKAVGRYFTQLGSPQYTSACALHSDGNVYCWGPNNKGQIGDGTVVEKLYPTKVLLPSGVTSFTSLGVGGHDREHNCAIANTGQIYCWGAGDKGQMGDGTTPGTRTQPLTPVTLPTNVNYWTSVYMGTRHNCAIADTNDTYCWGENTKGKLGVGGTSQKNVPTKVSFPVGVAYFTRIAAADYYTCALADTGMAYCWGEGKYLGNTSSTDYDVPFPVTHPSGIAFTDISSGDGNSCGLGFDGVLYCWDGSAPRKPVAKSMPSGVSAFTTVSVGGDTTCGLANNGNAYCSGNFPGDGSASNSALVKVSLPSTIVPIQVVAGCYYGCALGYNSNFYCWGRNNEGSVGDGTKTQRNSPVLVTKGTNVCD